MAHSDKIACGKVLVVSVRNADTVKDVKEKYAQSTGASKDDIHISFRENILQDSDPLHKYGIPSGQLSLVSLGQKELLYRADDFGVESMDQVKPICLAARTTKSDDSETITVISSRSKDPDLSFKTIRLSCGSHPYSSSEKNYAGFILYGLQVEGKMLQDWQLNGRHCKSAYLVVQGTDSDEVKKYKKEAPGQVHGAVYWNIFGKGTDVSKAIGEGFALQDGKYKWNSITFNANSDSYHDGKREISRVAKKCVRKILDDWQHNSSLGKTYSVKELLSQD